MLPYNKIVFAERNLKPLEQNITKKSLITKLLLLIFIILFVQGFTVLFGNDNLLMGVTLLTALLMYAKFDIGYKHKEAPFLILTMFIFVGISSYISLLNPVLGIIINLFSVFTIVYVFGSKLEYKVYLPFVLCYIFAQGTPVSSDLMPVRITGLFIGAVVVSLAYYIIHRKTPDTEHESLANLIKSMDLADVRFQFAAKLAIGITIAMFIGELFHLQKAMWISASVFSLIQPEINMTKERIKHRLIGTLIGAISFIFIFVVLPPQYSIVITLLLNYVYMFVVEYRIQMIFITINALNASLLLFDYQTSIPMRLWFIVVGAVIAASISKADLTPMFLKFKQILRPRNNLT